MTGPFGIKETSTKKLAEAVKIETEAGELAAQVLKAIKSRPPSARPVDSVRAKITQKARDNLEVTLAAEKKNREKLFKALLKLENAESELHDRCFKNQTPGSILREDFRRRDKLRTSIGFVFANLCQSYQCSEVNIFFTMPFFPFVYDVYLSFFVLLCVR